MNEFIITLGQYKGGDSCIIWRTFKTNEEALEELRNKSDLFFKEFDVWLYHRAGNYWHALSYVA